MRDARGRLTFIFSQAPNGEPNACGVSQFQISMEPDVHIDSEIVWYLHGTPKNWSWLFGGGLDRIVYGVVPDGLEEDEPAKPLILGRRYQVFARYDGMSAYAGFALGIGEEIQILDPFPPAPKHS